MVFNNTKVFLHGFTEIRKNRCSNRSIPFKELNRELRLWDVLVDPARKIRIGNKLYFGDDDLWLLKLLIIRPQEAGPFVSSSMVPTMNSRIRCSNLGKLLQKSLTALSKRMMLPAIRLFCQTRRCSGSSDCGSSFQPGTFETFEIKGINFAEITLHVGLGNFRSVDVEDLTKHKMDSEQI